jgi:hypothetical protein
MMRFRRSTVLAFALPIAGWACTAAGYGIGAAADSGNKVRFAPSTGAPTPFAPGQKVRIVQKDGSVVDAKYRGIHTITAGEEAGSSPAQARSVVRFEEPGGSGTRDIPMDDVALIESTPKSGRTVGLVLGAMLDLAGIIAYIADPSGTY